MRTRIRLLGLATLLALASCSGWLFDWSQTLCNGNGECGGGLVCDLSQGPPGRCVQALPEGSLDASGPTTDASGLPDASTGADAGQEGADAGEEGADAGGRREQTPERREKTPGRREQTPGTREKTPRWSRPTRLPSQTGPDASVTCGPQQVSCGARCCNLLPSEPVAAGESHTCALTKTAIYCWGANSNGELAVNVPDTVVKVPTQVKDEHGVLFGAQGFAQIAAGQSHTCAAYPGDENRDPELWCWGNNTDGRLDQAPQNAGWLRWPMRVHDRPPLLPFQISAGTQMTCALHVDSRGQVVGPTCLGTLIEASVPDLTQVRAGDGRACAVRDMGLECWGFDGYPPAEDGIDHARQVTSMALGWRNLCFVDSPDGEVYCWGLGGEGQNGDGATQDAPAPVSPVLRANNGANLTNAIQVAVGDYHACAVTSAGKLYCWGRGAEGQLGQGGLNLMQQSSAAEVPMPELVRFVATGGKHTCAVSITNKLYCWGYNFNGQLGNGDAGSAANVAMPTQVLDLN